MSLQSLYNLSNPTVPAPSQLANIYQNHTQFVNTTEVKTNSKLSALYGNQVFDELEYNKFIKYEDKYIKKNVKPKYIYPKYSK